MTQTTNILTTIDDNMVLIRDDFKKRKAVNPEIRGRVFARIVIDHNGKVIECSITEKGTTILDESFRNMLLERIRQCDFGPIHDVEDTTEINFPFVLTS